MRMMRAAVAALAISFLPPAVRADSPFATSVVSYAAGVGAASGFTNPQVALGSP